MKRYLWLVVVVAGIALGCWLAYKPAPAAPIEPAPVHSSDLPKRVYKTGHVGYPVRVAYPFRLHPTENPLVWEFRPGSKELPLTHRIHFTAPPVFPPRLPVVVTGVVDHLEFDLIMRPNEVPGFVVISGASVVPPASP